MRAYLNNILCTHIISGAARDVTSKSSISMRYTGSGRVSVFLLYSTGMGEFTLPEFLDL